MASSIQINGSFLDLAALKEVALAQDQKTPDRHSADRFITKPQAKVGTAGGPLCLVPPKKHFFNRVDPNKDNLSIVRKYFCKKYVIKTLNTIPESISEQRMREAEVLIGTGATDMPYHRNVLEILQAILDKQGITHLVLKYYPNKSLYEYIELGTSKATNLSLMPRITRDIAAGLEHIHHYGILHRDIKPENIFVDKRGTCVIGDFGLAYILSSAHCEDGALSAGPTAACGTSIYAAYELIYNPSKRPYTSAVDLWSLGVTLYVCAEKNIPFYRSNVVPADWDDGDLSFNRCWREEQYELMQLIKELLRKDPQQRLTAIQVLQHPLFATNAS